MRKGHRKESVGEEFSYAENLGLGLRAATQVSLIYVEDVVPSFVTVGSQILAEYATVSDPP
jgi:hypothetical protein